MKKWIAVLTGSAAALAVPFIFSKVMLGSFLPSILTQLETDSLYYLTIIKAVIGGDLWAGNPYILEYHSAMLPALTLPFWLSAIPGLLGLHINTVMLVNALLYGVLTGAVLYALNQKLSTQNRWIAVTIAIVGVASLSNLILRPALMQTVYPVFGLFMLTLLAVLEQTTTKRLVALGIMTSITFYLYPHLWTQTFSAVGLLYLWTLYKRDWQKVQSLTLMGLGIILICLPQTWMMVTFFNDPELALLSTRNGLIETHAVLPLTILNNKYTILFVLGLLFLHTKRKLSHGEALLLLLGSAIVIAALSNIITGKEIDAPTHPWRPGLFVTVVGITVLLESFRMRRSTIEKYVAGFCMAALIFTTVNRTFIRMNSYAYIPHREKILTMHELQRGYNNVFAFINEEGIHDSVFLADERFSWLLPLYTDNFVFFTKKAGLHVIPDAELQERFLAYYVDRFDAKFMKENVEAIRGVSTEHAMIYVNAYPDHSPLGYIKAFALGLIGKSLPGDWDKAKQIDFIGGEEFIDQMSRQHAEIKRNYEQYLEKYQVQYMIEDQQGKWNPRLPRNTKVIYKDERYIVHEID